MIGHTLSHYRVVEKLGQGGMGMVYKARDTHLERFVAIKVLPPERVSDPERKRRFVQEARAASALNHPNIITVHDVASDGGVDFIVMELVSGKTLAELIGRKGLKLSDALQYAIQVADALAAAHRAGIVHRDFKPGNVMVTERGLVKVLDFGLAKLTEIAAGELATTCTLGPETEEGAIVGTAAYMAPEQAEGKRVDARSDIFSFGCVLYEMITGRRPFQAETKLATLSAILHQEPQPIGEVTEGVPPDLDKLVARCLRKDSERRIQHMDDVKLALEELRDESESGRFSPTPARPFPRRRFSAAAIAVALLLAAAAAVLSWRLTRSRPVSHQPTFIQLTDQPGAELYPSLSPDGKSLVYASPRSGNWDIYLQRIGGSNPINLTKDSPADDTQAAFSPDGDHIAFRSERDGGGIFVMGATGENVRRLTDFGYSPAWSPDGKEIVCATMTFPRPDYRYGHGSQLFRVTVSTGAKHLLSTNIEDAVQPHWSPQGRRVAYWGRRGQQGDIWTVAAQGGEPVMVTNDAATDWSPAWSADGKYLYFASDRGGSMNLWCVPIDEGSGKRMGPPEPVTTPSPYSAYMSPSADGKRIAYVQQTSTTNIHRIDFDPVKEEVTGPPVPVTQGSREAWLPDLSPDGAWLAFGSAGKRENLYLVRTDGTGLRQLTEDVYRDRAPHWSPDSKRIAFMSNRSGPKGWEIWTVNPDGSGLKQLTYTNGDIGTEALWSPDGARLAYITGGRSTFVMEVDRSWKEQSPRPIPSMEGPKGSFVARAWSADGRRLAGEERREDRSAAGLAVYSLESGQFERLAPSGTWPQWLSDSRRLLFELDGKIYLADSISKKAHQVLSIPPHEVYRYRPSLTRDDRRIYFGVTITEADIWLMNLE